MSTNFRKDLSPQVIDSLLGAPLAVLAAAEAGVLSEQEITQHQHKEAYDSMSQADEAMGI